MLTSPDLASAHVSRQTAITSHPATSGSDGHGVPGTHQKVLPREGQPHPRPPPTTTHILAYPAPASLSTQPSLPSRQTLSQLSAFPLTFAAFSPNSRLLAFWGADRVCRAWDVQRCAL